MNWLAHLYLSEPDPQFRVGNLLPDLARRSELASLPEPFQRGIRCHRQIDVFTDAHPRVKSCVARFRPPYRRFGGILTDVYFDHFLARDWTKFCSVALCDFITDVYRDIEMCLPDIPFEAAWVLYRMLEEDWLGSYPRIAGIRDILRRISGRLQRPIDLSGSVPMFAEQESAHSDDFHLYFPELISHVQQHAFLSDRALSRMSEVRRSPLYTS
jgi:acyl carrier protein phosphodiesterase